MAWTSKEIVPALVCFTSAGYVVSAPIVALNTESFTPIWLGLLVLLATWLVIIGVDQLWVAKRKDDDKP